MSTSTFPAVDQGSAAASGRRSSTPSPSLQRGKACLSCRRRKMKCDGVKPVCTPCLRGERAEDCEYTDGPRRPRTLTLEEDIARLRARVQELENPEDLTPSVQLHAPYADASTSVNRTPVQGPSTSYRHAAPPMRQSRSHGAPSGGANELHSADIEGDIHFHTERVLSVITPYAGELGFFLDMDRLRVQGTSILPALQSALTLWSVHITSLSEPDHIPARVRERTYALASNLLSQTQMQLASALSTVDAEPDPTVYLHLLQAGVLLAYYMQRVGQKVGARYYASGTWSLGMLLKLHQGPPQSLLSSPSSSAGGAGVYERVPRDGAVQDQDQSNVNANMNVCAFTLAACARWARPLDGIEAEERVRAFWVMYALDRWFSAICEGSRQSLARDGSALNSITVPWPGVRSGTNQRSNAVTQLLHDPNHDFTLGGVVALNAKASVLLGEATAIAGSYMADHAIGQSPVSRAQFTTLDTLLQRCLSATMTLSSATSHQPHGHQTHTQEQGQLLVAVHLLALAHITLHRPFITTYEPSRRRCIDGVLGVVQVLDQVGEVGVISPIYAMVWVALCLALHDEVVRLRRRGDIDPLYHRDESEMMSAIRRLVGALSALSQRWPSRFFAANIEAVLPVLESITI